MCIRDRKGDEPHMLVMSATPLPRTLGLLLFADLDLSRVDELPPGRKPIKTRCVSGEKRLDMYRYLAQKAQTGEQAYVICPAIEENEYAPMQSVESLWAELSQGVMAVSYTHLDVYKRQSLRLQQCEPVSVF